MKKLFMVMAAAFIAVSASAQIYVGGTVGLSSVKNAGGDSETAYRLLPEIGYNLNEDWAVGTVVGWGKGNPVNIENVTTAAKTFEVNPYVRYTFLHNEYINVFCDGAVGYKHYSGVSNELSVGLKPGVSVNLHKSLSFVAHVGFIGYKNSDPKASGVKSSNAWGLNLDGNNVSFGLYYNF